jgi:hypothetical protein
MVTPEEDAYPRVGPPLLVTVLKDSCAIAGNARMLRQMMASPEGSDFLISAYLIVLDAANPGKIAAVPGVAES